MSYECHITTTVADAPIAEKIATERGWKTSEIKRDPVLGDGSHFYLTAHHGEYGVLFVRMTQAAKELREQGCSVLREKIEHIVYDTKTGVGLNADLSSGPK